MRNRSLAFGMCLAAGSVASVAQAEQDLFPAFPVATRVTPELFYVNGVPVQGSPASQDRADIPVFDTGASDAIADFFLGNNNHVIEDVSSFAPGLWDGYFPRHLTRFSVFVQNSTSPALVKDLVIHFYDEDDVTFAGCGGTGTNMVCGLPLHTIRIPSFNFAASTAYVFDVGADNLTSVGWPLLMPSDTGGDPEGLWMRMFFADPGATQPYLFTGLANGLGSGLSFLVGSASGAALNTTVIPPTGNPAVVGATGPEYGRDVCTVGGNPDFIIRGNAVPTPGTTVERRYVNNATVQALSVTLTGDVVCPLPPNINDQTATCIGSISDSLTVPGNRGAGVIHTIKFCTVGAVQDDNGGGGSTGTYMDIDSNGSTDDHDMALYDDNGILQDVDSDDGDGTASQLVYGIGRRSAVGDSRQYDGRDGEFTNALGGTFNLVLADPGTVFDNCFQFSGPASRGPAGAYAVNFNTNLLSLTLPASVAPEIQLPWGLLTPCSSFQTASWPLTYDGEVVWAFGELDGPGTGGAAGSEYVDMDTSTGSATQDAQIMSDPEMYLFDSLGNFVDFDDVDGPNSIAGATQGGDCSALTFGDDGSDHVDGNIPTSFFRNYFAVPPFDFGPSPPAVTNNPAELWDGRDGDLGPGFYYVALTHWSATNSPGSLPDPSVLDRWHVRSLGSAATQTLALNIYYGSGAGGIAGDGCFVCDSVDFNRDGIFPDQNDLDTFFTVFGAGTCPTGLFCQDIDVNNDGAFPDQSDIDAMVSIFGAGPCVPTL